MCKGSGRQAGNKEEPPGGYPLPECGGWRSQEIQRSAAAETGEAMKDTEKLSCCTSTVKGKAKENVALLLHRGRRLHDKESEKGQVLNCFFVVVGFVCFH